MAPSTGPSGGSSYLHKTDPLSSHSRILSALPAPGLGRRVLDVGGGEGFIGRELARRGYDVVALAQPGTVTPDLRATVSVVEADLDLEQPSLGAPFDVVICGDVLEHLRRPGDILNWLRRALVPGGRLIASLPNGTHAWVRLQVLLGRFPKDDRGLFDRTHLHFFSWSGWQQVFAASGFAIETCTPTPIPFGLIGPPAVRPISRGVERANYAAARVWKTMLAYQFIVVARPVD